jgi:hypothetical protein
LKRKYGLAKIDECLKQKNSDLNIFTFGIDLTNFGLNLNESNECKFPLDSLILIYAFSLLSYNILLRKLLAANYRLFPSFGSPFSDYPTRKIDPQNYNIPKCYLKPQMPFNKAMFKKFPEDTLFYIFYNVMEEAVQMLAVEEL